MNIIFTIIMIVFFVLSLIGGAIDIFGLDKDKEEEKKEEEKKEEVDTVGFATDFEHSAEVFAEFGKLLGGTSLAPEKKVSVTYTCVNCGAPIKSKHCEYCGTEYR